MFDLPPSLARHFRDAAGRLDYDALLGTPDDTLFALACEMPPEERELLYVRLLRLSWLEQAMARAAGIDVDSQRHRFMHILEVAHEQAAAVVV